MEHLPVYVPLTFGLTVLVGIWLFAKATHCNQNFLIISGLWIVFQSVVGLAGVYTAVNPTPPRFPLLLVPPILAIVLLFSTAKGRAFLDGLDARALTLFHVVRVPVELVLFWLFVHKAVPELMTFEGRNFDILSGLSAPLVYYFGFRKSRINRRLLLVWNVVCLGLVLTIMVNALLSAPTPFQQFGFEQPNIAIQYFPFVLLPSCLVPLVLLGHFAMLRRLMITTPTRH